MFAHYKQFDQFNFDRKDTLGTKTEKVNFKRQSEICLDVICLLMKRKLIYA